jgi:hypothetical protein
MNGETGGSTTTQGQLSELRRGTELEKSSLHRSPESKKPLGSARRLR